MNELDLRKEGRALAIPSGDVDAVVGRGATLARRRHRTIAGGMAVVLAATAMSYVALTRDGKPTRVLIGDGPVSEVRRGDAGIRWEKVPVRTGIGWNNNRSEGLYAVSTAPGPANINNPDMRPVLWHSADGVDWANVRALGDLYLGDLADRGARLYGVGTGPATAAVGNKKVSDLIVGWSDNGGEDWDRQTLPVDLRAMTAKTKRIGVGQVEVAATDQAVVATAMLMGELDVPKLLPDGQTAPNGWVTTADGVDVLGDGPQCPASMSSTPPGDDAKSKARRANADRNESGEQYSYECFKADGSSETVSPQDTRGVKASYTWAQLGVDDDLRRAVRSEPFVFVAKPGTTEFERVDVPGLKGTGGQALLDTNGDGLLLVLNKRTDNPKRERPGTVLLKSTDGRQWVPAQTPPGFGYALGLGRLGQRTALVGGGENGGATLWLANPDGSWAPSSLAGAVDPAAAANSRVELVGADVGPLGVVAVVSIVEDRIAGQGGVKIERNGYTLTILNDHWDAVVTDSNGKEVARSDSSLGGLSDEGPIAMRSDGAVAVTDQATGKTLVTFPADSMRDVFGKARNAEYAPVFRIVATRDGATWSDEDVKSLAGEKVSTVSSVIVTGERAVVTAILPNNDPKKVPAQVALVGTPKQ